MIGKSIDHAETVPDDVAVQRSKAPRARGAGFALFIAAIALFFTVVGIAAGYKHWQRMHDRAKDNARRIEVMEVALAAKMDGRDLAALMTLPVADVAAVSARVNQLLAKLPTQREIASAAADSARHRHHGSMPSVMQSGGKVVVAEVTDEVTDNVVSAVDGSAGTPSFWSVGKQQALSVLNHFVLVQKIEPSAAAALQAGEQEALYSLLRLRLESLRLMALQGDKHAYQQQISLLRHTLDEFATHVPEQLSEWRTALDELASVDLQSKRHDISGGLRQLRQNQRANLVGIEQ